MAPSVPSYTLSPTTTSAQMAARVIAAARGGDIEGIKPLGADPAAGAAIASSTAAVPAGGEPQPAPLAGNIFKVLVQRYLNVH